jgi:hypothetical protein
MEGRESGATGRMVARSVPCERGRGARSRAAGDERICASRKVRVLRGRRGEVAVINTGARGFSGPGGGLVGGRGTLSLVGGGDRRRRRGGWRGESWRREWSFASPAAEPERKLRAKSDTFRGSYGWKRAHFEHDFFSLPYPTYIKNSSQTNT